MSVSARSARAVFATVGLGIGAYCVAEGGAALPLIALPVWALAWPIVQGPNGKPLPRAVIFGLVLAATAYVVATVLRRPEDLVASVSRYIVWLELIKLYDRTTARDRGQLLAMSVFLALGACLTSNSMWLGLALGLYLPALLYTAMLNRLAATQQAAEGAQAELRPADRRRLDTPVASGSGARRQFGATVALCGCVAALVASVVFVVTPRRLGPGWTAGWAPPPVGTVTGFTDEVRLGAEGLLSVSETPVFTMRVVDAQGRDADDRFDRILMRGAVLEDYDPGAARWRRGERRPEDIGAPSTLMAGQVERISKEQSSVRGVSPRFEQRITFRNKAPGPMFAMYRPVAFAPHSFLGFAKDRLTQTVDLDATGRVAYTVVSQPDAPITGGDALWAPRLAPLFRTGRIHDETVRLLRDAGLARDESAWHTADDDRIAEALERHLRTGYEYTTEMTAPRAGEDPIEMFLFDTRRGHCEYFASAMAAMCRSVGMDARVVTGYVASERNEEGAFLVRESHAHAWVEASVGPGVWRTYDPSPPDEVARLHAPKRGLLAWVRSIMERSERLWIDTIVGFDDETRTALLGASDAASSGRGRGLGGAGLASASEARTRIAGAVATGAIVFAAAFGGGFALLALRRWWGAWVRRRRAARAEALEDPTRDERLRRASFYAELVRAIDRAGVKSSPSATPLQRVAPLAALDPGAADAARDVVGLYYAARFGRRTLTDGEVERARALVADVRRRLSRQALAPAGPPRVMV